MSCFAHRVRSMQSTVDYDLTQRPCGASDDARAVFSCCNPGDTCLEHNICHSATPPSGNGTGYYIAGCTDRNFEDPACAQHCFDQSLPDLVYNDTSGSWSCCSSGIFSLRCDQPSPDRWAAPAPEALRTVARIPASATVAGWKPAITASSSSTSTPDPSATAVSSANAPSNIPPADPGLSTDAKAGIIAAAVVLVLAFLAAGAFVLYRRRRRWARHEPGTGGAFTPLPEKTSMSASSSTDRATTPDGSSSSSAAPADTGYISYKTVAEAPAHLARHEMHGRSIAEMPPPPERAVVVTEMPTSYI